MKRGPNSSPALPSKLRLKDLHIVQRVHPNKAKTDALLSKVSKLIRSFENIPPEPFEECTSDGQLIELFGAYNEKARTTYW
ncbi:unnamed protein product [Dicrocoelium dendriticum]|nr:unnamed protein product [Dicrocoelium dendriticum]